MKNPMKQVICMEQEEYRVCNDFNNIISKKLLAELHLE